MTGRRKRRDFMKHLGFRQGKASPCVSWHWQRDINAFIREDDFVSSSERAELEWLCKWLREEVRHEDDHGRRGRRHGQGGESIEPTRELAPENRDIYEADPMHAGIIIRDTGAGREEQRTRRDKI